MATLALGIVVVLAVATFDTQLGVAPGHPLSWAIRTAFFAAGILGVTWGLVLKDIRPLVYTAIGLGARSATSSGLDAVLPGLRGAGMARPIGQVTRR